MLPWRAAKQHKGGFPLTRPCGLWWDEAEVLGCLLDSVLGSSAIYTVNLLMCVNVFLRGWNLLWMFYIKYNTNNWMAAQTLLLWSNQSRKAQRRTKLFSKESFMLFCEGQVQLCLWSDCTVWWWRLDASAYCLIPGRCYWEEVGPFAVWNLVGSH